MIRAALEPEKALEELTTEEFLNRYEEMAKKEAENGALKGSTITGPQEGMKDKVRVQTKEGDVFEITEEGVEYKGNINKGEIQETPDLKDVDITFKAEPTNWTNTDVTVTIKVNKAIEDGYYLEYAQKLLNQEPGEDDWKDCATEQQVKLSENGNVYVRLRDSSNQDAGKDLYETKTVNNIDKTPPQADAEGITVTETSASSISLSLGVTDEGGSGIDKVEWSYKKKSDSSWTKQTTTVSKVEGINNGPSSYTAAITIGGLEAATEYDITATVYDVAGTSTDVSQITKETNEIPVTSISLDPSTKEIVEDDVFTITVTITPGDATNQGLTWSADQTEIVKMTTTGTTAKVQALKPGKTTITVKSQGNPNAKATCAVTVKAKKNEIAKQYGITQSTNKQVSDGSNRTNNNMWIPKGYTVLDPEKNENVSYKNNDNPQIDEGIVISDAVDGEGKSTGNEFVWVPVDDINNMVMCQAHPTSNITFDGETGEFTCKEGETSEKNPKLAGKLYATSYGKNFGTANTEYEANSGLREPAIVTDNSDGTGTSYDGDEANLNVVEGSEKTAKEFLKQLQNEFNEMAKSVAKYKGFYIGRYETGNLEEKDKTPVVKAGDPNNANVNWYWHYKNSKKIAKEGSTSSMIWGSQWDVTMKWFISCGGTAQDYVTDSAGRGWYNDNISGNPNHETGKPIIGGDGEIKNRVNNIYDMAGNVEDWTIEANNANHRIYRGRYLQRFGF